MSRKWHIHGGGWVLRVDNEFHYKKCHDIQEEGRANNVAKDKASISVNLFMVCLPLQEFCAHLILKSCLSPKEDVKMLVMNPYVTQIYKCLVSRNCLTSDRTQRFCFFPELLTKLQITKEILMNIANVECIVYSYKYNTKSSFRHILCNLIDWFSYQNKKYIGEHLTKWNFLIYV